MTLESWQLLSVLLGGFSTLAVFSFLIKENRFYRVFEHIFIGIAAGFGLVFTIKSALWPQVFVPLLGLDIVRYPDGTFSGEYNYYNLLFLLPMSFGMLYYFIYSSRYAWLAKLVIGFSLGISAGLSFKGFFNEMLPQIIGSFKPLAVFVKNENGARSFDWTTSLNNIVFVVTLLLVMYYFFFSFKTSEKPILQKCRNSGRWLMMICFGAFFGSTVMARLALLVERLEFLSGDWFGALKKVYQLLAG